MSSILTIDDNNFRNFIEPTVDGEVMRCESYGFFPQDITEEGCKGTFDDLGLDLIPESEWSDRIRQKQKDKTWLVDLANDMGMEIRNQRNSNYCWVFGTCRSAEYALLQTGVNVRISPFSVGGPSTGFRNVGGWGDKALDQMARDGFNLADEWPDDDGASSISRRYYTDENRTLAKQRRVLEYYKLTGGRSGWRELVTCVLSDKPVAVGFNWWSHLVCATWLELNLDLGIDNSWGTNWGSGGRGLLSGNRKYADGAVVINSVRAM